MNKTVTIIIIVVLLALGGWLIFRNPSSSAPVNTTNTQVNGTDADGDMNGDATASSTDSMSTTTNSGTSVDVGITVGTGANAVKEFTVNGSNFAFSPSTMKVKKGDTVKVTFKNTGGFHDFKIDEFKVATKQINGGAQETVTFVASKSGTFEYYCSVGQHRQMGMRGNLIVE